jgi:hypothetical protein
MQAENTLYAAINDADLAVIEQQLGRKPRGILTISKRSSGGVPLVLSMQSFIDAELFPTLYWLCSKDLHRAIAEIETAGFVKTLDKRLQGDQALCQMLEADHCRYIGEREALMTEDIALAIANKGLTETLAGMGIGGSRNWHTVRCLHMHYAQHLVSGNCIGQILDDEFQLDQLLVTK